MLGSDFHFRDKVPVGILGATGSVGQKLVELLGSHPWFEIAAVAASDRSAGKKYVEAVNWVMPKPIPAYIAEMKVQPCLPDLPCALVFSGLDSSIAGEIETNFANAGYAVISNSQNHRMDADVPLLIPEINSDHLDIIKIQQSKGKIITNPNCSVIGLTMALKPIMDKFGIQSVNVVTLQAVSGAGYPGVASLDIIDNIIPFIAGEERKIETEPLKILGTYSQDRILNSNFTISAHCNRVPVSDGHMACVSIKLAKKAEKNELIDAWKEFQGEAQLLKLPLAPDYPIHYFDKDSYPQPKLHRNLDNGMAVSVGRLRDCPLFDYKFVILSHNTIRGAAGGAILNAELLVRRGYVFW